MRTCPLTHQNYVTALNLVQIDFADVQPVMAAMATYLVAFHPDTTPKKDCNEIRRKAIVRLLTAIADDLGYAVEQLDLMEQVYSPEGWATAAVRQRAIQDLFVEIAEGKKTLPVSVTVPELFVESLGDNQFGIRTVARSVRKTPPAKRT